MELYSNNDYRYYLSHHQRKGAKWGVMHGPPYPLNREGRAKFNADRMKRSKMGSHVVNGIFDENTEEVEVVIDDDGNEEYLNTAEIIRDTGKYSNSTSKNMRIETGNVNPEYGSKAYVNNCTKCAATLQLRTMGYDVVAGGSMAGCSPDCFDYWFDGAETKQFNLETDKERGIYDWIEEIGNGKDKLTGSICMFYDGVNGHAFNWEATYDNDWEEYHIRYFDGQDGEDHGNRNLTDIVSTYGFDQNSLISISRLDESTPNWDHMAEDSVIRNRSVTKRKVRDKETGEIRDKYY